ncbi:MAG: serine/threonine protein kinase, partial [Myxococcales bacterium]
MRLGRFVLLSRLGAGGMGVVYVAYDEHLDRKVAVKMLHSRRHAGVEEARRVLLREAQALGRLSHPNVVTVHEVGVHEGRVFLAMEFVAGSTLRSWQQERPRTVEETLRVYRQAGAGLVAAHACGLVHRDFKPENVMVSDDGRVRVLDFGLARFAPSAPGAADESEPPASQPQAGTPAYMAPEQHAGQGVDARTDQFAFCVALYEALYGERPFEGSSLTELRAQVCAGQVRATRRARGPRWVQAALRRGLQPDPGHRWPSMQALLEALGAHPLARWRRRAAAAVAVLGAVGLLAVGRWAARPSCDGAAAKLGEVWGPAQREAVRRTVSGAGGGQGAFVWERLDTALGQYHRTWSASHTRTCLEHRRGELSSGLLDASMSCLEQRRGELQALVGVLSGRSGPVALEQVLPSVQTLDRVELCSDRSWLGSRIAPPDGRVAPDVERLRARLVEGKAPCASRP